MSVFVCAFGQMLAGQSIGIPILCKHAKTIMQCLWGLQEDKSSCSCLQAQASTPCSLAILSKPVWFSAVAIWSCWRGVGSSLTDTGIHCFRSTCKLVPLAISDWKAFQHHLTLHEECIIPNALSTMWWSDVQKLSSAIFIFATYRFRANIHTRISVRGFVNFNHLGSLAAGY